MPGLDDVTSWADEVLMDSGNFPPTTEVYKDDQKIITEYTLNNDDKMVKVVRTYKITKQEVSKSAARRKGLPKFGDSTNDKPGPNPHTTIISQEDIQMQFITAKEEEKSAELLDPLKSIAKCRICNGEHWSVNCPYKGTSMDPSKIYESKPTGPPGAINGVAGTSTSGKYVPPFLKDSKGALSNLRNRDDTSAIRISNLSESTVEADLEELVKKIGPHSKMYLARDKVIFSASSVFKVFY